MTKISDLLGWHLSQSTFKSNAANLINPNTKKVLNQNIFELHKIASVLPKGSVIPKVHLLEDVYQKFIDNKDLEIDILQTLFTKKEVRLLVWSLDYNEKESIINKGFLNEALQLIEQNWKESYIVPLWLVVVKNWSKWKESKTEFKQISNFFQSRLKEYSRSRKDVLALQKNNTFWIHLEAHKEIINKYSRTSLDERIKYLKLPKAILNTDYYYMSFIYSLNSIKSSEVKEDFVLNCLDTISKSNNRTFKLIALSSLVTSFKFKNYLKNIQRSCFQIIGDPLIKRHWVSASLSSRDSELVGKAQKILIMLLNKDFIEVFFSRLVQDSRREKFWLQFVDEIEDVKFIGNTLNYQILKNIESVSKYVDSRYSVIRSNQSTSAIIIWAKGYVFVEFTDVGALYIYKKSSFKIKLKHVSNLRELKVWPKGSSAIRNDPYRSGYYELSSEGTLNHSGAWEQRLQVWMKKYY